MIMIVLCDYSFVAAQPHGEPPVVSSSKKSAESGHTELAVEKPHMPTFALKTNLLYDLAGGVNVGVELPIGERFSVAANLLYAHLRINNQYTVLGEMGELEARYWFGPREKRLTGLNVGVYGMYCNRFDVQWGDGYQGDGFWSGGISAGYSMPLSDRFNLDFSISGGYVFFPENRHYHKGENDKLLWQETRYNVGRISLTNAKVSLVWLFK